MPHIWVLLAGYAVVCPRYAAVWLVITGFALVRLVLCIYRIVSVIYSVACIYSASSVVSCFVVLLPDAYVTTFI